jgi:hypothetical protein
MGHLYRGLHERHFNGVGSMLAPKEGAPFLKPLNWETWQWVGSTWGQSEANAVIEHQHEQRGRPMPGISTTPHFELARVYALGREDAYLVHGSQCPQP